jgi:hypothetical protein
VGAGSLALDLVAVRRGALGVLMFVAPAYAIALALRNTDSSIWLVFVAALFFGSAFGGYAAARDRPPTPISHAAVAAASGLAIVIAGALLFQAFQGDLTLPATLTALVILQIGTAFGCVGGALASKGYRR